MGITIETVTDNRDLVRVVELQEAVWGPGDYIPAHLLRVLADGGGVVHVARLDGRGDAWVGFSAALPARDAAGWYLHSHMAGVTESHRRQGVGRRLKEAQRAWAAGAGYPRVGWTFDPLRAGNAHFNLSVLGAHLEAYWPDHYPALDDVFSAGRPTDRALVVWPVDGNPSVAPTAGQDARHIRVWPQDAWDRADRQTVWDETLRVRHAFLDALGNGWRVTGFEKGPDPRYVLARQASPARRGR